MLIYDDESFSLKDFFYEAACLRLCGKFTDLSSCVTLRPNIIAASATCVSNMCHWTVEFRQGLEIHLDNEDLLAGP